MSAPLPPTRLVVPFVAGLRSAPVLACCWLPSPAQADNRATPRNFTGYGFDQCVTPSQSAMDAWLRSSPFWAVGIYISGDSRGCRDQPNQTPQLGVDPAANGWRLLPITLGPAGVLQPAVPALQRRRRVNPSSTRKYAAARLQGRAEAVDAVGAAKRLGSRPGQHALVRHGGLRHRQHRLPRVGAGSSPRRGRGSSTSWTTCPGVYSSAGSGMKAMDDARRRTGPAPSPSPTRSGSRAGTARPTPRRATSAPTAGCRVAA